MKYTFEEIFLQGVQDSIGKTPDQKISTNCVSKAGWGAIFDKETTDGHFALDESLLHINLLELKAAVFGLKSLCSHLRQNPYKCYLTAQLQCVL